MAAESSRQLERNIQFYVNTQLYDEFAALAKANERSVAGQLRMLMSEFVRKSDPGANEGDEKK